MSVFSRRDLFRNGVVAGVTGSLLLMFNTGKAWAADVIYKVADLATSKKNPSIGPLKYVDDAATSKDRTAEKMGVAAKDQTCVNCNFYKEPGTIEGTKDAAAKCLMLGNQVVYGKGWCNVWSKKA